MKTAIALLVSAVAALAYPGGEVQEKITAPEVEKWTACDETGPQCAQAVRWSKDGCVMKKDSQKECVIESVFCKYPDTGEYGSYWKIKKSDGSWVVFARAFGIIKKDDGSWNTDKMVTAILLDDGSWDTGNRGDSQTGVQPVWDDAEKKEKVLGASYCLMCMRDGNVYLKSVRIYCNDADKEQPKAESEDPEDSK